MMTCKRPWITASPPVPSSTRSPAISPGSAAKKWKRCSKARSSELAVERVLDYPLGLPISSTVQRRLPLLHPQRLLIPRPDSEQLRLAPRHADELDRQRQTV